MKLRTFNCTFFTIILIVFFSCKSDDLSNVPDTEAHIASTQTIVIIKADDLRNLTPNWQLFISTSIKNDVPVSIGIISRDMTDINTIASVKKMAN